MNDCIKMIGYNVLTVNDQVIELAIFAADIRACRVCT